MRRFFCLLAPLIVIGYLYAQWSDWFTWIELGTVWKRPLISDPIDLEKKGSIEWIVPKEGWIFQEGEADLELALNLYTMEEISSIPYQIDLRVKVRAQGRVPGGEWQDRLIRNKYFHTDEPFSKDGLAYWHSSSRGRLVYCLGGVRVVEGEELRILIEVQVPDRYRSAIPRLRLVGKNDHATHGPTMIFRGFLREGGFWLSFCLVLLLAWFGWTSQPNHSRPKP